MLTYIRFARLVQFAHLSLSEPQGFLLELYINLRLAIVSCIYDNFIFGHNMTLQHS